MPVSAPTRREGTARLLTRLLLVGVALAFIWLGEGRHLAWLEARRTRFLEFPVGLWLSFVLMGVLAGVAFGIARGHGGCLTCCFALATPRAGIAPGMERRG
jgi:hypothetical protein